MNWELDYKKFYIACGIILLIWASLWLLFYLKADEVTRDPCSICAEKMGDKVRCTTGDTYQSIRTYYPNGSTYQVNPEIYSLP